MSVHYGTKTRPGICGAEPTPRERGMKVAELPERNVKAWHLVDCVLCLIHRPAPAETSNLIAAAQRLIRALEARCTEDPAHLPAMILLAQQLSESVNVAIAVNMGRRAAATPAERPFVAPSGHELAGLLGMKPQSITDRRKLGDRVLVERLMGQETMAQRDRLARTKAQRHADAALAEFFGRRESVEG